MNNFLQTRWECDAATTYLRDNKFINSGLSCKDWEASEFVKFMQAKEIKGELDIVDLGSSGSVVLDNAVALGIKGVKCGIDLVYKEDLVLDNGVHLIVGDLMQTPFEDESFDVVVSLSTIEHDVDLGDFAKEVSRIVKRGGDAIVSFDYWPERIDTRGTVLYNLDWQILNVGDVNMLISEFAKQDMHISGEIDWTVNEKVITPKFCSPSSAEYTFGILNFIKK